jgi:hypothetical protein
MIMKRMFLLLIGTFLACAGLPMSAQEIKVREVSLGSELEQ